jgi:ATP-binding protein involved in chromosome partitioning
VTGPSVDAVRAALGSVLDPEIRRPITELGMVKDVTVSADGTASVALYLTVAACPMKESLRDGVTTAVTAVPGVRGVEVTLDVMSADQREELRRQLRGGIPEPRIPFADATSRTRVFAIASGKGGVGKSSVTVNLAVALAATGASVGVVDADIYGFSVPRMLGIDRPPTRVDDMILPPMAHGVKVISIGMFVPGNQPVVWRGPMLHRAVEQFLSDVFWDDLDVLLLDLPPGTGDVAISVGQLLPTAEIIVVTTPQQAAAEVAERAGAVAAQTRQRLAGVVENMSWLDLPGGERLEIFGSGGGARAAEAIGRVIGTSIPVLGQIPIDVAMREGGDSGRPVVLSQPRSPAAQAIRGIADRLAARPRGLLGKRLDLTVTAR